MRNFILILTALFVLNACGLPGELPMPSRTNNTVKGVRYVEYGIERFRPIEMVCYIDTSRYNPLNALDYTLEKDGAQFFDYVILGGAFLKKDHKGFYLSFSDDLLSLLERKRRMIVPLQTVGIKVMLGVESQGNASLGNVNEDQMYRIAHDIYTALQMYDLDGVEFYDNAEPAAYPPEILDKFDPNNVPPKIAPEDWNEERWKLKGWEDGGDNLNNFFYTIRYKYDTSVRETVPMMLREKNYGSFLPNNVSCTAGFADFASSAAQITYTFNIDRSVFKPKSDIRFTNGYTLDGNNGPSWILANQYGPFFLELDGEPNQNVFFPQSENFDHSNLGANGQNINYFLNEFNKGTQGKYQAIYIHNLKAVSQVRNDPFYKNPFFTGNPNDPDQDEFANVDEMRQKSKFLPPVLIFNYITRTLLNDNVVCSGGDHLKDW